MKVLITGATGTLGKTLVEHLYPMADKIIVYSRCELKQFEMKKDFPEYPDNKMRYMIGDIRDKDRLKQALRGVDVVLHTAALKQVPSCEYNPTETYKTNIEGSINVANACHEMGVKKCILVSTDKAVNPLNTYGCSKMAAEKYFISANNLGDCKLAVCRYGNVKGSRGSVIPIWKEKIKNGETLDITHMDMTRFWITVDDAAMFIISRLDVMQGGEIFIPELEKKKMIDIAAECRPAATSKNDIRLKVVGLRPGEKLHEELVNIEEARNCYKIDNGYIIYPTFCDWGKLKKIGKKVNRNFTMTSEVIDE